MRVLRLVIISTIFWSVFSACHTKLPESESMALIAQSGAQLQQMIQQIGDTNLNPRCLNEDGSLRLVKSRDWTSGFFPGCLWMQYELTHDEFWREKAEHFTQNIEDQQWNGKTHDMGFKMLCSYGNGFRLTNNSAYKKVLLQSADTLITRFNPKVGCIRSWDHHADEWEFPVIIDNMMNLELLFWAFRESKDSTYYNIAYSHAMTTLKNNFRDDYSSYHVVNYDTITGKVISKQTHQGVADNSAWARGQAWALYGFTMAFRETGDSLFLQQAEKVAGFIMNHKNLPTDGIPYWDFDDPKIPDAPRDASAAAVICSGLYELNLYQKEQSSAYREFADKLFNSLSSSAYFAGNKASHHFLLNHSTGNYPKNDEIDVPIVYADYYFLEAFLRKIKNDGYKPGGNNGIVLKLDDLKPDAQGVHPRWQRVYDYALKNQVPIAIGVVANTIENGGDAYCKWLAAAAKEPIVELWNHGYDHKKVKLDGKTATEFRGTPFDFQQWHLQRAQELMDSVTGTYPVTFGAPYNHIDSVTSQVLNGIPEIKIWLYADSVEFPNAKQHLIKRIDPLNIEYPVQIPNFYQLWNNLYFYRDASFIVIQGHPKSWDNKQFEQFTHMVTYIKKTGFNITLPKKFASED